ncbi:hypothetical protein ABIE26_004122 [Pedobacter africanus]|uniref:Uncharacterized protein n=1 Tax=Pedobacter africanus TaxID=151894 RepID=A0ACC6L1N0_9SPHI|nr:hypothetical protein [Pedobacter africanus]
MGCKYECIKAIVPGVVKSPVNNTKLPVKLLRFFSYFVK